MREKELPGQIELQGEIYEEMKRQADRIRRYEIEKDRLKTICTSCEEYERGRQGAGGEV